MTDIVYIRLMDFVDLIIKRDFDICAVIYDAINTSDHDVLVCVLARRSGIYPKERLTALDSQACLCCGRVFDLYGVLQPRKGRNWPGG